MKNNLMWPLSELPQGIRECLMTARLKLDSNQMATVVSAYAPTLKSQDNIKEAFYASLENILSAIPKEDKIILLGDFNARVGHDYTTLGDTIGREQVDNINSNGFVLLSKSAEHNLTVTSILL